jgi:hypothetical protein
MFNSRRKASAFATKLFHDDAFHFPDRVAYGLDEMNLLAMHEQIVVRQPIDDPQQNVRWKIERRQCETDTDDVCPHERHESRRKLPSDSRQSRATLFQPLLLLDCEEN